MPNCTAHTLESFSHFPWEELNDKWFEHVGTIGHGGEFDGVDFSPYQPHISFYRLNGDRDIWAIPLELADLLEHYKQEGRNWFRDDILELLQLSTMNLHREKIRLSGLDRVAEEVVEAARDYRRSMESFSESVRQLTGSPLPWEEQGSVLSVLDEKIAEYDALQNNNEEANN